jgi:hypothetical protein
MRGVSYQQINDRLVTTKSNFGPAGLIIMGKTHLYLVDGLYQNQQGDIVAAVEAPKDAFLIPGVALELDSSRLTQKWCVLYLNKLGVSESLVIGSIVSLRHSLSAHFCSEYVPVRILVF